MSPSKVIGPAARLGLLIWTALLATGSALPASTRAATVSTNWAGYVAVPSANVGSRFSSVSGSWRQPSASCGAGRETYSALWVGLGGYRENAASIEQIGTDADCALSGRAGYSSWFELLPAAPVNLKLRVHPGDEMSASVTVRGRAVTLRIRDLSTGERFTISRGVSNMDVSSADWIVEAPSACVTNNNCQTLALTNFGDVAFSSASATARGHTGAISDPAWPATALELRQSANDRTGGRAGARAQPTSNQIVATPSPPSGSDGAFSVSWLEQSVHLEGPSVPALPGFNGGPP